MKTIFATIAAATLFSAPVQAGTIWDAMSLTGSQRLYIYALSQPGMGKKEHAVRAKILGNMGFVGHVGQVSSSALKFHPVLRYDNNVNGGFPTDSVTVGSMTFVLNPKDVRVSGVLMGAGLDGGFAMPLANGLALSTQVSAEYAMDFEHGLAKGRASGQVCLNKMANPSTWLDACAQTWYSEYDLGSSTGYGVSVAAHKDFMMGKSINEVTVQLRGTHNGGSGIDGYNQQLASVRLTSALSSGVALFGGVDVGTKVDGYQVMRERAVFGISGRIGGKISSVSLSAQNDRGGMWLGQARHDRTYALTVTQQITKKLTLSASLTRTKSSADVYDGTVYGLNARFAF